MMADPHSLIEGVIISAFAIRSHFAVIYVRGEAVHAHRRLVAAVEEAYAAGYLGTDILGTGYDLELVVHAGAGAYICGEETALLDSLEGYRGQPRLKPPFPAVAGLYGAPPSQQRRDAGQRAVRRPRWRRLVQGLGPEKSPGPKIYSLSGHVVRPGQYEAPMGTTLRELLEMAGGIRAGHELKFWTPGGSSTPYFTAEHLDVPLDFELGRRRGLDARHDRAAWCSTRPTRSSRPPCGSPSSTRTRAAASAPRAGRAPTGWCRSSSGSRTAGAPPATSTSCSTPATTSWAARSAPSVTARRAASPARSSTSRTSTSPCCPRRSRPGWAAPPARARRSRFVTAHDQPPTYRAPAAASRRAHRARTRRRTPSTARSTASTSPCPRGR